VGKRTFDVTFAMVGILLTLPLMLLIAIGTTIQFRAWPIFGQERVGRNGRAFRIWKFRTLPKAAPAYADKRVIAEIEVPAFAQFLRRTHLDELPQLLLVLWGRMSIVGPRPEMQFLHDRMDRPFAMARTAVRPGCTGLWQLSDRSGGLILEAPEFDLVYLERSTVRFDAWILGRTILRTLGFAPPLRLEDVHGTRLALTPAATGSA
jgi:lipopolysaccharide/colanic/teichoic acid biosynthesis glycosyltransferase